MANLLEISRDIVSRTPEGKEALIAMRAIGDWKSSARCRARFLNFIDYYDHLAAGKSRITGGIIVTTPPGGRKGSA